MKATMVMFDSLNRHYLPPYGCDWTHAPNFARLAARCDLHTGRPSFLHRAWGRSNRSTIRASRAN